MRVFRWWPLAAVAAATMVLAVGGVIDPWPGLVHGVAVPPFDLWFDLRVLVARAPSYPVFVLGVALSLAARTAVLAAILGLVGPAVAFRRRAALSLRLYLAAVVPMWLASGFAYAGYAALYHWYAWTGLGIGILTFVLLAPAPLEAARRGGFRLRRGVWRGIRSGFRGGIVVPYLVVLLALGAVARSGGSAWVIALVPVSAALTAVVVTGLARPGAGGPAPAVAALVIVPLLLGSSVLGVKRADGAGRAPVLVLVPGVDTWSGHGALYRFDPAAAGGSCDRTFYYSYLGSGPRAPQGDARCPIRNHAPYRREDTQAPLETLVGRLQAQVDAVGREAPDHPIAVITHSQGAWIAWRALTEGRAPRVSALVMLGAVPRSGGAYPPPGADGSGRIGGDVLRALAAVSRGLGIAAYRPDAPLGRELMAPPGALDRLFGRPLPSGVRALSLFSSFDVAVAPRGWRLPGVGAVTVNATHAGLPSSPDAAAAVRRFLDEERPGVVGLLPRILGGILPALGPPPSGVR